MDARDRREEHKDAINTGKKRAGGSLGIGKKEEKACMRWEEGSCSHNVHVALNVLLTQMFPSSW